ncbi:MAG: GYDIA family GHMP kinase [Bacteroidales bacterium]
MNCETNPFYSRGKFLLTAEYLVMAGADAIVLPLNKGQSLSCTSHNDKHLLWISRYQEDIWFRAVFDPASFKIIESSDMERAIYISEILRTAATLSKKVKTLENKKIITDLEFHPDWGMGSSSTLMVNLSQFFDIQAFEMHSKLSKGSGFDIAAAMSNFPFRYRLKKNKREIMPTPLPQLFYDHAFFVYTGQKADSNMAAEEFHQNKQDWKMPVKYINEISAQLTEVKSVTELSRIIGEHEAFLSDILGLPSPVKRFADYPYGMKSLGAWGGDFIMAIHPRGKTEVEHYFKQKGCDMVFSAHELKINS